MNLRIVFDSFFFKYQIYQMSWEMYKIYFGDNVEKGKGKLNITEVGDNGNVGDPKP